MSVITDLTFRAKASISLSLPICTSPKCKEIWGELLFDWELTVPVIAGRKYSVQSSLILYSWPASTVPQLARPPTGLLTAGACSPPPHQRLAIASFAALILSQTALILSEIQPIAELAIFLSPLNIPSQRLVIVVLIVSIIHGRSMLKAENIQTILLYHDENIPLRLSQAQDQFPVKTFTMKSMIPPKISIQEEIEFQIALKVDATRSHIIGNTADITSQNHSRKGTKIGSSFAQTSCTDSRISPKASTNAVQISCKIGCKSSQSWLTKSLNPQRLVA